MLEVVQPSRVDPGRSSAGFDKHGVEVTLAHADDEGGVIWATVGDRNAIAGTSHAHERFDAPSPEEKEDRAWTTEIVDFIAEILRGQIEVETTFRGDAPISVKHFGVDERGERRPLGSTFFFPLSRFFLWLPKRTESERVSWL